MGWTLRLRLHLRLPIPFPFTALVVVRTLVTSLPATVVKMHDLTPLVRSAGTLD